MKKNIIETIKSNVILMHNEYEKQKGQININHISWGTYTHVLTRCGQNWIECMWLLLLNMFSLFFVDARRDKKKLLFHTNFVFNAYMKSFNVYNNHQALSSQNAAMYLYFKPYIYESNGDCSFLEKAYWKIYGIECASRAWAPTHCYFCAIFETTCVLLTSTGCLDSVCLIQSSRLNTFSSLVVNCFIFIIKKIHHPIQCESRARKLRICSEGTRIQNWKFVRKIIRQAKKLRQPRVCHE